MRHIQRVVLVAWFFFPLSTHAQTDVMSPIWGDYGGVDHVGVGVRDLESARRDFERLGFKVDAGGHFPGGLHNNVIFFDNKGYLELLAVDNTQPKSGDAAEVADFLKKGEGAMFLGLQVTSAQRLFELLKARDFDVSNPNPGSIMQEGENKPPAAMWYAVSTPDKPAPGKRSFPLPIFFIQYLDGDTDNSQTSSANAAPPKIEAKSPHANTALHVRAVWFAVKDPKAQIATMTDAGFNLRKDALRLLDTGGQALDAGVGQMVLLHSDEKKSDVADYLAAREDGILAITIEVSDLKAALAEAESATGKHLKTYQGSFGTSFLVPASDAHGVWIEFFQK